MSLALTPVPKSSPNSPYRRATTMLFHLKARAERKGISFDLTREWILERYLNGVCEVTGMKFCFMRGKGADRWNDFAPSVDRKDRSIGYTQNNCQMVTWWYNRAKGDKTNDEMMVLAKAIIESRSQIKVSFLSFDTPVAGNGVAEHGNDQ